MHCKGICRVHTHTQDMGTHTHTTHTHSQTPTHTTWERTHMYTHTNPHITCSHTCTPHMHAHSHLSPPTPTSKVLAVTYMKTYVCANTCTGMHACTHTHTHACMHTHTPTPTPTPTHPHPHTHACTHTLRLTQNKHRTFPASHHCIVHHWQLVCTEPRNRHSHPGIQHHKPPLNRVQTILTLYLNSQHITVTMGTTPQRTPL